MPWYDSENLFFKLDVLKYWDGMIPWIVTGGLSIHLWHSQQKSPYTVSKNVLLKFRQANAT
jgi:hypothetical protein